MNQDKKSKLPWQIELFRYSLMKKEKVALIQKLMSFPDKKILDIGCSQGTVSYKLKQNGGQWLHTDVDFTNLETAAYILGKNVFQLDPLYLPVRNEQFELVLTLDFLEHIDHDRKMIGEIFRVLKKNGRVIISTPISGKFFLLNKLKYICGLYPEIYGHKREGYSLKQLAEMLSDNGFIVETATTYAKFFTELFEILLNIAFSGMRKNKNHQLRTGSISPASASDLKQHSFLFSIYRSAIYPLLYGLSQLDKLLWFKTGYATLIIARKADPVQ
jgi:2-polyprenyl-3-methyl-5-hydroxy-6-metoxy-1,4-benzoquinol methylase